MNKINRKEIKKEAIKSVKKHYFRNIIVTFIVSVLILGGFTYNSRDILKKEINAEQIQHIFLNRTKISNDEILKEILKQDAAIDITEKINSKYTNGVIATVFNEITKSGSVFFGLASAINKMIFQDKIGNGVIMIIASISSTAFTFIFIRTIEVGEKRYFLEKRRYNNTKIQSIVFPYKQKKNLHIACIIFVRFIKQLLWNLTIIGGVIKYYEYKFIPYILAENPDIKLKKSFEISKELSKGYKLQMFKLDLSLIGLQILNAITFNFTKIFFSDSYIESIYAEIYMFVRKEKIESFKDDEKNNTLLEILNDYKLDIGERVDHEYPQDVLNENKEKNKFLFNLDYNKNYSLCTYILLFLTFSICGWLWEVFLFLIIDGKIINRGVLYGPWLPIYGCGGVLILFFLKRFRNNPVKLFIASFISCGIVEYGTSLYLDVVKHVKYWDYTGNFLNINGRICLEGLIFFAIGGLRFYIFISTFIR